jgi:hypothetical protein
MRPLLLLLVLGLGAGAARAQAWTEEPGRLLLELGLGLTSASQRFDAEGGRVPYDDRLVGQDGTQLSGLAAYLRAEYGVAPHLALSGAVPYRRLVLRDPSGAVPVDREEADLGTAALGLRLGLGERVGLGEGRALAVYLGVRLPLGYRRNVAPAVGSGQVDLEGVVSYGHRLARLPVTLETGAGYRYRTGIYAFSREASCPTLPPAEGQPACAEASGEAAYSDQLLSYARVGYDLLGRVRVEALADLTWSVEPPGPPLRVAGLVQPAGFPRERALRVGGALTLPLFDGTELLGRAVSTVSGQDALAATEWSVGLRTRL